MKLKPMDFAFSYITRTGRVDPARLTRMSPAFMAQYGDAQRAASRAGG